MAQAFNILGPLQVLFDGVNVTPTAPRERSLLALLLVHNGQVVSADRILEELWPRLPVDRGRRVLWVRVAGLRRMLNRPDGTPLLQCVAPGYRLTIASDDVDIERFFTLLERARCLRQVNDPLAAARTLRQALDLWRGEPLADAQTGLVLEAEAARLADAHVDAAEDWIDAELACGHHDQIQSELCRLLAAHPLRERLWRQRVVALYRAGRAAESLAACHEFRVRLADELGLDPSDDLGRLEYDILRRDPSLIVVGPSSVSLGMGDSVIDHHGRERASDGRHNLPAALTRFVGRAGELEEVRGLLRSYRLVTLTGVGGVGKTRLALETAATVIHEHHDGVWLVELAPLRDDAAVPTALARALGVLVDSSRIDAMADHLAEYLAHRRVLLVLDNAEHVVGGVTGIAHRLLTSCPDVTVLVTSRELLRSPGEATYAVPPLSLPPDDEGHALDVVASDAVTLFNERARAARPGFVMTAGDAATVAKICRRLDGIPLAIELAAARMRMLGTHQLASRLDDCFPLLTNDACTVVAERHRTLHATLDWSYQLLAPAEQVALRRLAVFRDHFDLEASLAVIEGDMGSSNDDRRADGFTLLSRLVDKSLVTVVGDGTDVRYRLLEPVRQYAAEKLAAARETEMARRWHRDVFLDRPKDLWPLMTAQTRHQTYADRENYRAALEWSWQEKDTAAALRLVAVQTESWMCVGDTQAREWLERVVAEPEPAVHPARVRALNSLALSLHDSGHGLERVDQLLHDATALAEQMADATETAACKLTRVDIALTRGNTKEARTLVESAMRAYEHLGSPAGVGWCYHYLGWIATAEDDYEEARARFQQALEAARSDAGSEWLLPHALAALAPLMALHGEPEQALRLADEAVAAARPFSGRAVLAMALARAAETAVLADDTRAAGATLEELVRVLHDLGTRRWAADALELVAVVLERRGENDDGGFALGASAALRAARGEEAGGVRAVSEEVRRSTTRLHDALGPDRFAAQLTRGAAVTPELAMTEMRRVLGIRDVPSVGVGAR